MYRVLTSVPDTNILMLRVACKACAHRIGALLADPGYVAWQYRGETFKSHPIVRRDASGGSGGTPGTRCDFHDAG